MERKLTDLNHRELQNLYIEETKAFLEALQKGESWLVLEDRRARLREISVLIDIKIKESPSRH